MKLSTFLAALLAGTALAVKTSTLTVTKTKTAKPSTVTKSTTLTVSGTKSKTVTVTNTASFSTTLTSTALATTTTTSVESDTSVTTITSTSSETDTATTTITETDSTTTTSTETDTTTVTTTTTTSPSPTFTNFIGSGNLVVYSSGSKFGHVSKYGGWYTSSSPATYTGNSLASDNSFFTLTTSQGPCAVLTSSGALNCTAGNSAATFGQTMDGNLTFAGSQMFGSQNPPTTNAPGSLILDMDSQFDLMIQWVATS